MVSALTSPWRIDAINERFAELVAAGKTANAVAQALSQEFNRDINRNAVIGRCHRLGMQLTGIKTRIVNTDKIQEVRFLHNERRRLVRARARHERTAGTGVEFNPIPRIAKIAAAAAGPARYRS